MGKRKKSNLREWMEAILAALIIVIFIRAFIFDLYTIPSTSMEKSILVGDFMLTSKLSYGPRLPITPLAFPFSHQYLPFTKSTKSYSDAIQLPYLRIPGFSEVNYNDVVVFNYPAESFHPVDQRTYYVKRCVGLPGDIIRIDYKQVFANDSLLPNSQKVQYNYHVNADSGFITRPLITGLGISEGGPVSNRGDWQLVMTDGVANQLRDSSQVHRIVALHEQEGERNTMIFPYSQNYSWNQDFFGPIYVPKAGDSILITTQNLPLYERLITLYEKNELKVQSDSIYINGELVSHYKFDMDYYFMMGDNRQNSGDSRRWGFVPEDHIVAKAICTVFSVDKFADSFFNKVRWNRFFKSID